MRSSALIPRACARKMAAALFAAGLSASAWAAPLCQPPDNLIPNAGFEDGAFSPGGRPTGWSFQSWSTTALGTWDDAVARSGRRSVRIDAANPDDALWLQTVQAPVNTPLYLSGWIKSSRVVRGVDQPGSPGATLSVLGRWDQPAPTLGTTPWHPVGMSFISDSTALLIAPRLGFWGGLASGTAWYDDLSLVPRVADAPHPRWKILVLVYPHTDVTLTDAQGLRRRLIGATSQAELDKTAEQARLFVETDIPALSSGNMLPTITLRYAREPLRSLSPILGGWWPAQGDVMKELDPEFDSVIVVWEPRVRDATTGEALWIGAAAGLTPDRGLGQTYVTMSVEYAGANGHRNVYKHEWGHSILSYFQALGVTPQPTVTNHASESQYVNCKGGPQYVWQDEVNDAPIPNSIYSNSAGFTHDYYSGTVARAEEPRTCLGIGPQAWAWGGPATHSGSQPVFGADQRVNALIGQIDGLKAAAMLNPRSAQLLRAELMAARWALASSRPGVARASLRVFTDHVQMLVRQGQLLQQAGALLAEASASASTCAARAHGASGND
ncbi:MAG: hypothetical protein JSR75_13070 [Proteobacteria bacterium]|nr:hypothetical protein [Pseudomonadota bacterium]